MKHMNLNEPASQSASQHLTIVRDLHNTPGRYSFSLPCFLHIFHHPRTRACSHDTDSIPPSIHLLLFLRVCGFIVINKRYMQMIRMLREEYCRDSKPPSCSIRNKYYPQVFSLSMLVTHWPCVGSLLPSTLANSLEGWIFPIVSVRETRFWKKTSDWFHADCNGYY